MYLFIWMRNLFITIFILLCSAARKEHVGSVSTSFTLDWSSLPYALEYLAVYCCWEQEYSDFSYCWLFSGKHVIVISFTFATIMYVDFAFRIKRGFCD